MEVNRPLVPIPSSRKIEEQEEIHREEITTKKEEVDMIREEDPLLEDILEEIITGREVFQEI